MKKFKKIKLLILSVLVAIFSVSFDIASTKAVGNHISGSLLTRDGVAGSAVYLIGADNKKYIFPDSKTYLTWYDGFWLVQKVSLEELDLYPDGGAVTYRPGTKLLKHADSNKVFAIEAGGVARHIPTAAIASELYGANWTSLVQDIDPGIFVSNYTEGEALSIDALPTGTLVRGVNDYNTIWYVQDGVKRKFESMASFTANNFNILNVVTIKNLNQYVTANNISARESSLADYITNKNIVQPIYHYIRFSFSAKNRNIDEQKIFVPTKEQLTMALKNVFK